MGEMIQLPDTKWKAYLAESGVQVAPGILIMHAWWGLIAFMKGLADLASFYFILLLEWRDIVLY